ncbi:hypothetical protein GGR50DRAFT_100155 [Xylaria sp. CBS 124048]|nr:hypothetical protein GGR50DRAFT_100155 [Xylaria sp. CBS 124048]
MCAQSIDVSEFFFFFLLITFTSPFTPKSHDTDEATGRFVTHSPTHSLTHSFTRRSSHVTDLIYSIRRIHTYILIAYSLDCN